MYIYIYIKVKVLSFISLYVVNKRKTYVGRWVYDILAWHSILVCVCFCVCVCLLKFNIST